MLNSNLIIRHFKRYYTKINNLGFIINEISDRMIERLDYIKLLPENILILGYGLGADYKQLQKRYIKSQIYALDISLDMLKYYGVNPKKTGILNSLFFMQKKLFICADLIDVPVASQSMDLIWSNLALVFVEDYKRYFLEINRILRVGGTFLVSGLGVDSLQELRELGFATFNFPDMHLIGDILVECGFNNPVTDLEKITLEYDNIDALLSDVRSIGVGSILNNRLSLTKYKQLKSNFAFRTKNGKVPLTLEIFYAHAWKDKVRGDLVSGRNVIHFHPLSTPKH